MADSRHEHLRRLFDRALELPAAARTAFLDSKCGTDAELKQRLQAMLAAADGVHMVAHPTQSKPGAPVPEASAAVLQERPGACIGPYKLLQQIGEGGFGAVFMAQQEEPVTRTVALKIIKLGMDTRQVVARFEQERQALALMDHPNIARVLDAGVTETGRPYFVMDLVKGAPIVEYCDRNQLTIDERLNLFTQVCSAVQHAHGKGIIHRDLKPSNILVGSQDGKPQAKVIDFGIAKATSSKLTDKTLFTEHQQVIGTLQYMSPEQAAGSLDIDTRTDVYSLGVLLYELLAGSTPFEQKTLREALYGEIQRMIREVEPPRPSTRLSESHDLLASIAARRRIEPKRLGMLLRGELDWIVMKALEKDRTRRYETASGMAEDIRRYLVGEAVVAAPPSALYRLRKIVHRHRGKVVAIAAVGAALVVGAIGFAWQAQVAQGERDVAVQAKETADRHRRRAEELRESEASQRAIAERSEQKATAINQFLFDMLGSADLRASGRDAKVAEALATAATKVGNAFQSNPDVEAAVRHVLARTYTSLGMLDEAGPQIEAAMALGPEVYAEDSSEFANLLHDLGTYKAARGDQEGAAECYRRAIDIAKTAMVPENQIALGWRSDYANQLVRLNRMAEAEALFRETLATQERAFGLENKDGQIMVNSLAVLLHRLGQLDEAEELYRKSLAIGERVLGPEHADTLTVRMNFASLLRSRKKDAEAEPLMVETYGAIKRVFGESHAHTAVAALNLARFHKDRGRHAEALALAEECEAINVRHEGELGPNVARSRNLIGQLLYHLGKYAEATEWNARAVAGYLAATGAESEGTLSARWELAKSLSAANRTAEAEPIFKELLEVCPRVLGADHWVTVYTHNTYAMMLMGLEKFAEAEPLARVALERGRRAQGQDNPNTLATQLNLASILRGLLQFDEAESLGRDAIERCVATLGADHATTAHFRHDHAVTLVALGRREEAEREFTAAIASVKVALGNSKPNWCSYACSLGKLLIDQGRAGAAEPVLQEAATVCEQARGLGDRGTARLRCELGCCLSMQGRFAEAEALLLHGHGVLAGMLPVGHGEVRRAERHLANHYRNWNAAEPDATRAAKAAEWQAKAEAAR